MVWFRIRDGKFLNGKKELRIKNESYEEKKYICAITACRL
jgi:hypothetical protein